MAYLKYIIEAYEGMAFISIVEPEVVKITVAKDFEKEVKQILTALQTEIKLERKK